jgi:hypothetical protein
MNDVKVIDDESGVTDFSEQWGQAEDRPEETTRTRAKGKKALPEGKPRIKLKAVLG